MSALTSPQRFIVMATGVWTVDAVKELLIAAGFSVDIGFPPVVIDERDGRFVLRACAPPESAGALAQVPGLVVFPDLEVQHSKQE